MKLTIFTPSFNRGYILHELYNSLVKQTNKNFEWLIIDDGSCDDTKEKVKKFIENNMINIRYYYIENGGKQNAINKALDLAYGELFLVVDSDDFLKENAVELILKWSVNLDKNEYCGFAGNIYTEEKNAVNPIFEKEYVDCSFLDRYPRKENNYFFIGFDRAWIFFTDVHRNYKYPCIKNEKFISEAVAWNRMANDGYKLRCFNDIIYVLKHQNDGLTNKINELYLNNPYGFCLWKNEMAMFTTNSIFERIYFKYSVFCDLKVKYKISDIKKFSQYSYILLVFFAIINIVNSIFKWR